jgi:hypothetical protein
VVEALADFVEGGFFGQGSRGHGVSFCSLSYRANSAVTELL